MNLLLRKDNKQRANQLLATRAIFKAAKRKSIYKSSAKNKDTKYKNKSQKQY